jgi:ADP-ribose pyrophosphatase YjhB (NUDIX family)
VLLVHRAHDPWRGMWSAPGGFCVYDEHPIDAVVRETREETGVAIEVTGFLGIWIDEYADAPAPDNDTISVAYYTAIPSGTVETTPEAAEVIEARWFAWNEIPAALAPPGTLRAVLDAWHEAGQSSTPLLDRPT